MKRFLSLLLAFALALSLCMLPAGAAYSDAKDIQYQEAIDVVSALNLVNGYTDGSFKPKTQLNRGQAAKLITNLLLTPEVAATISPASAPFPDVPKDHVFASYISYCASKGIINGYEDGLFRPGSPLSAAAFMKMLLGALGYSTVIEGYTGANWSVNVFKTAMGIGLDEDMTTSLRAEGTVTREEACLMMLNTLRADLVDYTEGGSVVLDGITVSTQTVAKARRWGTSDTNDGGIDLKDGYIQFAEEYFTSLQRREITDDFGRPSVRWSLKSREIGTYEDIPGASYTDDVKMSKIYTDLGMSAEDAHADIYLNGVLLSGSGKAFAVSKSNETKLSAAALTGGKVGRGTLTDVYRDSSTNDVTICIRSVYAGKISNVYAASSSRPAYIKLTTFADGRPDNWTASGNANEFDATGFRTSQYVLYTFSDETLSIGEVRAAESGEGDLKRYVTGESMTLGDSTYKYSREVCFDTSDIPNGESGLSNGNGYRVYFDTLGNIIYVEQSSFKETKYAYVLGIHGNYDFQENEVRLLLTNGNKVAYTTTRDYTGTISDGDFITYSVESDGKVKLTRPSEQEYFSSSEFRIVNKQLNGIKIGGKTILGDSTTIFLVEDSDGAYKVYRGIRNVPNLTGASATILASGTTAKFVVTTGGKTETLKSDVVFIAAASASALTIDGDNRYYTYNAVVGGRLAEVNLNDKLTINDGVSRLTAGQKAEPGNWNRNVLFNDYHLDRDQIITVADFDPGSNLTLQQYTGVKRVGGSEVKLGGYTFSFAGGAIIYEIDTDGEFTKVDADSISSDDDFIAFVLFKSGEITHLFVQQTH